MTGTISTSGEGRRIAACASAGEPIYRLEMRLAQVVRGMVEEVARFLPEGFHRAGNGAGARSSAGEHYVDIVGVTGSIPVAPTISNY
jgi:hypothetical protein